MYGNNYKNVSTAEFYKHVTTLRPKTDETENLSSIKRLNFIIFNSQLIVEGTDRDDVDGNERTLLHIKVTCKPNRPIFTYKTPMLVTKLASESVEPTTAAEGETEGEGKKKEKGSIWSFVTTKKPAE